ncbi:hypothetical protein SUGI_0969930 [Cryptomeria japonica]|uniref:trihelix transcription factor GTL1 n=1 Tax=Cryptomeria japonica TaxID=3369 RepID=UPI002414CDA0|nr:trihelix transcription factor GTL1 [Cryptomeria japonica]GLJ46037.1 hypothetical protein SUGI_0969930 [Cryptomeria japonica]
MQIGEQYGLAELQQFMVGRGHMLSLAQEMPPEIHLQYQQQQQQFHAAFQRHQIESHHHQQGHIIYQEDNRQNHHNYHHLHQRQSSNNNNSNNNNNGNGNCIAQQLSLGSDSTGAPSLSVSPPPSKRTISPPGIISKPQAVSVNGVGRDLEDYDEGFDEGDRSGGGGGGGNSRWPRQETLTLLKIRSEMDSKFREATHKGPLWDEISRVLAEHGYQRSSKKCREKFENLYKYYKKTKEGKAGRQDGKHYRFFSQLEALYGGSTIDAADACLRTNLTESPAGMDFGGEAAASQKFSEAYNNNNSPGGFSLSSDSSSEEDECKEEEIDEQQLISRRKRKRKHWKSKMKSYFDAQMKKFMDRQEAWLRKVLETLEQREQERIGREEAWRRQETARLDREHQLWSHERARAATCDAAFLTALQKITGENFQLPGIMAAPINITPGDFSHDLQDIKEPYDPNNKRWPKPEILSLIRLRTSMEPRFQEAGAKGPLWEEISAGMSCLGYDRSAKRCKEKWENINKYFRKAKDSNRKRPENSKTCPYFQQLDSLYRQGALGFSNITNPSNAAIITKPQAATSPGKLEAGHDEVPTFTSSHENDDVREAVETLGLMPSEDGVANDSSNNNNHGSSNAGAGSGAASSFFENGCNWEGYPMKLKMKQQQQPHNHL